MPCLNLSTNVNLEGVDTSSILSEATAIVADIIGKPKYVMIVLKVSVPMSFGGTEQPAAYSELVSIGGLNSGVNKKLSAAVSEILSSKLTVPKSRFFLKFYDSEMEWIDLLGDVSVSGLVFGRIEHRNQTWDNDQQESVESIFNNEKDVDVELIRQEEDEVDVHVDRVAETGN